VRLFLVDASHFVAPGRDVKRAARNDPADRAALAGEHNLIKEVHPRVHEIKEQVETVKEAVSPEKS